MRGFTKTAMMTIGILIGIGCQRNISDETGVGVTGNDPDGIPVYPRDVHGTVTFSVYHIQ